MTNPLTGKGTPSLSFLRDMQQRSANLLRRLKGGSQKKSPSADVLERRIFYVCIRYGTHLGRKNLCRVLERYLTIFQDPRSVQSQLLDIKHMEEVL